MYLQQDLNTSRDGGSTLCNHGSTGYYLHSHYGSSTYLRGGGGWIYHTFVEAGEQQPSHSKCANQCPSLYLESACVAEPEVIEAVRS